MKSWVMKGIFGIVKVWPPSTIKVSPVIKLAPSLAKKIAESAIYLILPFLWTGIYLICSFAYPWDNFYIPTVF